MLMNLDENDLDKIGFYLLHNQETDQTYVGSGILYERYKYHKNSLDKNKHGNYKLQIAFNKNPNFDFIGLPVNENNFTNEQNRELALILEQNTINENINNKLLLNISKNVEFPRLGIKDSEETILKKKEARDNYINSLSEEEKNKYSIKMRDKMKNNTHAAGHIKTEEEIQKWRESRKGYFHSEETRQKISDNNKGLRKGIKLSEDRRKQQQDILSTVREKQKKKVKINDVIYESLNDAARNMCINVTTVFERINNSNFKDWNYL